MLVAGHVGTKIIVGGLCLVNAVILRVLLRSAISGTEDCFGLKLTRSPAPPNLTSWSISGFCEGCSSRMSLRIGEEGKVLPAMLPFLIAVISTGRASCWLTGAMGCC
jgi:hypothetical protein